MEARQAKLRIPKKDPVRMILDWFRPIQNKKAKVEEILGRPGS